MTAGVALSGYATVQTPGRFDSGVERALNTFAFFTVQSDPIVGVTTLLLALRLDRRSTTLRTFRLAGLVTITATGAVYHVAPARIFDLDGIHQLANQLVHTVVPLRSVIGLTDIRTTRPDIPPGRLPVGAGPVVLARFHPHPRRGDQLVSLPFHQCDPCSATAGPSSTAFPEVRLPAVQVGSKRGSGSGMTRPCGSAT